MLELSPATRENSRKPIGGGSKVGRRSTSPQTPECNVTYIKALQATVGKEVPEVELHEDTYTGNGLLKEDIPERLV